MLQRIFKARELNNGFWIYGSLVVGATTCYIAYESSQDIFELIPVKPETICQSTNLKDIYNCLIFEGDKIRSKFGRFYRVEITPYGIMARSEFGFYYTLDKICNPVVLAHIDEL
jgi:hypothetical protein